MRLYVFIEGICIFLGFDPCIYIYVTVLYVRTIDARKEKKKTAVCCETFS